MSRKSAALSGEAHPCPECGNEYVSTNGLKYHMNNCCPSKLINCPSCDESYVTELGVSQHHSREHGGSLVKEECECDFCGCSFERNPSIVNEGLTFCSNECKYDYRSENWTGEDHHSWKPGRSDYGTEWRKTRQDVLKRDGYVCQACGADENGLEHSLEVHHIKPLRTFDAVDGANKLNNLITLCKSCHRKWEGVPLKPDCR